MHDILPQKGMCLESHNLIKVSGISDNILLMVQDRDIVAIERLIGNCIWPMEWHHF